MKKNNLILKSLIAIICIFISMPVFAATTTTKIKNLNFLDEIVSSLSISGSYEDEIAEGMQIMTPSTSANNAGISISSKESPHWSIYQDDTTDDLRFWNTANRVTFTDDGKVGIGLTDPSQQLDISGNFELGNTTNASQNGIIYKGATPFLHNFNYGLNTNSIITNGGNLFLGENAGNFTMGSTATYTSHGSQNIGIGSFSLNSNTTGSENTGIGNYSLRSNTTGVQNTGIGYYSLYYNTTGSNNTGIGNDSLYSNTTGYYNTGIGSYSLQSNTTGFYNTGLGYNSLYSNTTGAYNTGIGSYSLNSNTTGNYNTGIGYTSLHSNTTGNQNTGIGYNSGRYIANGTSPNQASSNSVYLGYNTKALASGDTNEIVIGYEATGVGSNSVVLGNDDITKTVLKGNVGIGTTSPDAKLEVDGNAHITGNLQVDGEFNLDISSGSTNTFVVGSETIDTNISEGLQILTNTGNAGLAIKSATSPHWSIYQDDATDDLRFWNTANRVTLTDDGKVGIGITSPTQVLDVAGNINFSTNGDNTLISNYKGANSDGFNVFIGGGGQSSVGEVGWSFEGSYNTGIGYQSLQSNTTGYRNTGIGYASLFSNTTGSQNTGIGQDSLYKNTTGSNNTGLGIYSLFSNISGFNNTGIGYDSLHSNTTGFFNTGLGMYSLDSNTAGYENTGIGYNSLQSNIDGDKNTGLGTYSLYSNTTANNNTGIGYNSLYKNTTGSPNTGLGYQSLYSNTTGNYNTGIGGESLYSNTTGSGNTGIGAESLFYNTTGYANTGLGYRSLYKNTTGSSNIGIGDRSLQYNTTGSENTGIGNRSLLSNTTGNYNIGIGNQAGYYIANGTSPNQTSSNSVYLGYNTKALADGDTNEIVIGYEAIGVGSNSVVLGNDDITKTVLKGNVGIGTTSPDAKLEVDGNAHITGDLQVDGEFNLDLSSGSSDTFVVGSETIDTNISEGLQVITNTGNAGLAIKSATSPHWSIYQDDTTDDLRFWNVDNRMTITNEGNVGIGTDSPEAKLEVDGDAHITGNFKVDGEILNLPDNNPSYMTTHGGGSYCYDEVGATSQLGDNDSDCTTSAPADCPAGFIAVPGNKRYGTDGGFCVMKYEAKYVGGVATSQTSGNPWVSITQTNAIAECKALGDGYHLVTNAEWMTIARNIEQVADNWYGGVVGTNFLFSGHNDNSSASLAASVDSDPYYGTGDSASTCDGVYTNFSVSDDTISGRACVGQKRTMTLSNGEVIWDLSGNVWEWNADVIVGNSNSAFSQSTGWKEFTSLSNYTVMSYASLRPSNSSWDATKSVGRIYVDSDNASPSGDVHAFERGGDWYSGAYAGVFTLDLGDSPADTGSSVGFRCAR